MARRDAFAFLVAGTLVLLNGCAAKAAPFQSIILCDFERTADPIAESPHVDIAEALKKPNYTNHDFRWSTSGYAAMEPISKDDARALKNKVLYKFIQGQTAAKVRFTVPGDYKTLAPGDKPKSWESGMSMATDSYTPLKVTDWGAFRYFDLAVYNPGTRDEQLHLRFTDSAAATTETSTRIPAGGPCTVEIDLAMLSQARINEHDMRGFTLFLDTANESTDPVLIFDNIGIHTATYEDRKRAELEEDNGAEDEDQDWDNDDSDEGKVIVGVVSRPGGVTGSLDSAVSVSASAAP